MYSVANPKAFQTLKPAPIHPVILSGGAGTRLWPLSRAIYPKQLLSLTSENSLLQETVQRCQCDSAFAAPIIVCNEEHRFLVSEQISALGLLPQTLILEPVARNTAPAIAVVALWLARHDPDALMLVQPADHLIGSLPNFFTSVFQGVGAAQDGKLVTFGMKPSQADTGFGYIQVGVPLEKADGINQVERFIEKPDAETAGRFVQSGQFLWNSGIFLLSARHYLDELRRLHPAMLDACAKAVEDGVSDLGFFRLAAEPFAKAPALSIDHAVMEHTAQAVVVPADMDWTDIGSWQAIRNVLPHDGAGNVVRGDAVVEGVSNSYIHADGRLVAAIGVDDMIIVSTDDAVLVAKADRAAEVGAIVTELRLKNRSESTHHSTVHRPWGYYKTTDIGDRFQVKRIMVKPGARLSLQKHFHRAEHWVVVQGTASVQRGGDTMLVMENESIYIPIGVEHRLENPGRCPLHLIEVQSGAYLGEDDIVRLADTYGRV